VITRLYFRIAIANLRTHLKRTLLIVTAIAFSVAAMQIVGSFFAGMRRSFFDRLVAETGHMQLQPDGRSSALDPYDLSYLIDSPQYLVDTVSADPDVVTVDAVLEFGALVIHDERNVVMRGFGISSETPFFSSVRRGITGGKFLESDNEIILSEESAELLRADIGDRIVILVEDSTGSPFYLEWRLSGVFSTGVLELDRNTFFISHAAAEDVLYIPGMTREIRITVFNPEDVETVAARYRELVAQHGAEIQTWRDIFGSMAVMFQFFDLFVFITVVLVIVVAATVITNAVLMNVFERQREFGTLRAIGINRIRQTQLILSEGTVQGIIGTLAGLCISLPVVLYLQYNGIDMAEVADTFGLAGELTTYLRVREIVIASLTGVVTAITGSLYAALVLARQNIVTLLTSE
jgi:putative ABC transport system permease protein